MKYILSPSSFRKENNRMSVFPFHLEVVAPHRWSVVSTPCSAPGTQAPPVPATLAPEHIFSKLKQGVTNA